LAWWFCMASAVRTRMRSFSISANRPNRVMNTFPILPAEEKETDRSGALARSQLSPEEQMLEIIRAFIVRQLAYPDGFAIVDHTKPQRVKAANKKPAQ